MNNTPPPNDPGPQPGGYAPQPGGYNPQPGYTPQQPGGYAPQPVAPRSSRPKWLFWLLGGLGVLILACILFFAATFFLVGNVTQPVVDAGDSFMNALKAGDYDQAYNMSTPALQQEVGDAAGLKAGLASLQPTTWSWSSRSLNNGQGALQGTASFTDGTSNAVSLGLQQVNNVWKVYAAQLRPN